MTTETITWHLTSDALPDADITVLAEVRDPEDTGTECWPAFWSGASWIDAGTGWPLDAERVIAWTDMPGGTRGAA